jgi:hypothetical protein
MAAMRRLAPELLVTAKTLGSAGREVAPVAGLGSAAVDAGYRVR